MKVGKMPALNISVNLLLSLESWKKQHSIEFTKCIMWCTINSVHMRAQVLKCHLLNFKH